MRRKGNVMHWPNNGAIESSLRLANAARAQQKTCQSRTERKTAPQRPYAGLSRLVQKNAQKEQEFTHASCRSGGGIRNGDVIDTGLRGRRIDVGRRWRIQLSTAPSVRNDEKKV